MIGRAHLTTANDTTIAWCEMGSGPPLVLLHGLADSHRSWRLVARELASRFHVFMVDLPGHGLSARPDAPYTLGWYADTIAQWMSAIGVERSHICGHSYGGGIAQWMMIQHRERIDRLALAAPGGLGQEVGAVLRLATLPLAAPLLETRFFSSATRVFLQWTSRSFAEQEPEEIERLALLNAAPNSGFAFHKTVSGCIGIRGQRTQTWDHIEKIDSLPPLALFWGTRDPIIPVCHAHRAAARLGNLSLNVYEGCGHSPQLETPRAFSRDLIGFLQAPGLPRAVISERPAANVNGLAAEAA